VCMCVCVCVSGVFVRVCVCVYIDTSFRMFQCLFLILVWKFPHPLFLQERPNVMVMTTSNITEAIDLAFVDRSICVCANEYLCRGEVGGWGRDPNKCTGSIWGMGSSTI